MKKVYTMPYLAEYGTIQDVVLSCTCPTENLDSVFPMSTESFSEGPENVVNDITGPTRSGLKNAWPGLVPHSACLLYRNGS